MKEKRFKKWEKTREKGVLQYVIINGALIFGLFGWSIILVLSVTSGVKLELSFLLGYIPFSFVGLFIGLLEWIHSERKYNLAKRKFYSQNLAEPVFQDREDEGEL